MCHHRETIKTHYDEAKKRARDSQIVLATEKKLKRSMLEHLAMLLTSTHSINCKLRNFLNKAMGIINFAKLFLNFISILNSIPDLYLSCARDFFNQSFMAIQCKY